MNQRFRLVALPIIVTLMLIGESLWGASSETGHNGRFFIFRGVRSRKEGNMDGNHISYKGPKVLKRLILIVVLSIIILLVGTQTSLAADPPVPEIEVLNLSSIPEPLAVGQSYTFDIEIDSSDQPFLIAMAMTDAYYPGRGVFWNGVDVETKQDYTILHLTVTGKNSTSDLPDGVTRLSISVGVRYQKWGTISERFEFTVVVP